MDDSRSAFLSPLATYDDSAITRDFDRLIASRREPVKILRQIAGGESLRRGQKVTG